MPNERLHKHDLPMIEAEIAKAGFELTTPVGASLTIWSGPRIVGTIAWRPEGWKPMTCGPTLHVLDDLRAWLDDLAVADRAVEDGQKTWTEFQKSRSRDDEAKYHGVHAAHLTRATAPSAVEMARFRELAIEAADLLWAVQKGKVAPDDPELRRVNQKIYLLIGK